MRDIFTTRKDWLLHVGKLEGYDVLTIHPRDGLTVRMIAEAMAAQGILYKRPGQPAFRIIDHGTKIFIQREVPHAYEQKATKED
jgi:hypothetical protein